MRQHLLTVRARPVSLREQSRGVEVVTLRQYIRFCRPFDSRFHVKPGVGGVAALRQNEEPMDRVQ